MLTILLDENLDGYAGYLSRFLFSAEWSDLSSSLGLRLVRFEQVGLTKGALDKEVWEFCQQHRFYLITDNRNQDDADSLEAMIRTRNRADSLPVFTISNLDRFRAEKEYVEAIVATLLEYLIDANDLRGTGRLYLP